MPPNLAATIKQNKGVRNVSFSEYFAYVLNEWFQWPRTLTPFILKFLVIYTKSNLRFLILFNIQCTTLDKGHPEAQNSQGNTCVGISF